MGKETVWVRNLKTGLVWLVDAEHAARLLESGEYVNAEAQMEHRGAEKRKDAKGAKNAKSGRKGAEKSKGAKRAR